MLKQLKVESVVKTERSGSNDYGTWMLYEVLASGIKYSWFRNTSLKGEVSVAPEVGQTIFAEITPPKDPKYKPTIKKFEAVDGDEGERPATGQKQAIPSTLETKVDKVLAQLERILAIQKEVYPGLDKMFLEEKKGEEIKAEDLPF